jgi:hypothetical protein
LRVALPSLLVALVSAAAAAALTQPNGTVIPNPALFCSAGQPAGLSALFACRCTEAGICNIGAACTSLPCDPGQNGTCETTLWHNLNDNACIPSNLSGLDPVSEASVSPRRYFPAAPATFQVLSRGTGLFKNVLAWYNAVGSPPALTGLHPILDCNAPVGGSVGLDLSAEPAYLGGDVGFALLTPESHAAPGTCAAGDCCATAARVAAGEGYAYYSEALFNPDAGLTIHLIHYWSHLSATTHYFAWEDVWGGADNEFTDLVASATGFAAGTDPILVDGFESGDLSAWSASFP